MVTSMNSELKAYQNPLLGPSYQLAYTVDCFEGDSCSFCINTCSLNACWICEVLVALLCLTLCDTMDCSPPGSSVHGILQARIREWVAIPFSRESSWARDQTRVSCTEFVKSVLNYTHEQDEVIKSTNHLYDNASGCTFPQTHCLLTLNMGDIKIS